MKNYIKKHIAVIICLLLSLFLLSPLLLPGYILTFDMTWTPEMTLGWSQDTFNNTYLLRAFIHVLSLIIPSWLVQKLLLITIFFCLFYIPYRFLPFVSGLPARVFSAGIFALNPFVYSRILSGQWYHVLAYAFLPFLLYSLVKLYREPGRRSAMTFFLALFLIGITSIHFLYLACIVSFVWFILQYIHTWKMGEWIRAKKIFYSIISAVILFIVINIYWIIPAVTREAPLEARFNQTYFSAFASAGNGAVPVMVNVAVLGGFWGEILAWRYYFVWPQDQIIFWIASILILSLVIWGIYALWKNRETRFYAGTLLVIGILAYITALGVAETPFKYFNALLYEHIPFWNGLRDSHKIAGVLALVYSVFAGVGVSALLFRIKKHKPFFETYTTWGLLILPVVFGMYMWGGFKGQINPIWYPESWHEAKVLIDQLPANQKVLVLPWHGYLSMDFAGNRIVSNPTANFFGRDRVLTGRGVEFGGVRDQEVDTKYRDMDEFLLDTDTMSRASLLAGLKEREISNILIVVNPAIPRSEEGLTRWTHFSTQIGEETEQWDTKTWKEMLDQKANTTYESSSLILLKIVQ